MARRLANATSAGTDRITVTQVAAINNLAALTYAAWIQPQVFPPGGGTAIFMKGSNAAPKKQFDIVNLTSSGTGAAIGLFGQVNCATTIAVARSLATYISMFKWLVVFMTYDTTTKRIRFWWGSPTDRVQEVIYLSFTAGVGAETSEAADNLIIGNSSDTLKAFGGLLSWTGLANRILTVDEMEQYRLNPTFDARFSWQVLLPIDGVSSPEPDASGNGNTGALTGTVGFDQVNHIPTIDTDGLMDPNLGLPFPIEQIANSTSLPNITSGEPWGMGMVLPRSADSQELGIGQVFDDAMSKLEQQFNTKSSTMANCILCPVLGAIQIDLSQCGCFTIDLQSHVSQITVTDGADGQDWCISFINNTGNPITVGGWPPNVFMQGGSGSVSIPPGGATLGTFHTVGQPTSNASGVPAGTSAQKHLERGAPARSPQFPGGGGGGAGGGVAALKIAGPDTFPCSGARTGTYQVSGGVSPYTWSVTLGTLDTTTGNRVVLTPPANSGSGVAGTAYNQYWLGSGIIACNCYQCARTAGCDDATTSCGCDTAACCVAGDPCAFASGLNQRCTGIGVCVGTSVCSGCTSFGTAILNSCGVATCCTPGTDGTFAVAPKMCDRRTAPMIAAGCNPCVISMDGAVLTVTDSRGVSVVKTLILT